jgi:hypothetical protein
VGWCGGMVTWWRVDDGVVVCLVCRAVWWCGSVICVAGLVVC